MRKLGLLWLAILAGNAAMASDALIKTDISVGQGFLYKHNDSCYTVTPAHVVDGASTTTVQMSDRKTYAYKTDHVFDVDLAVLSTEEKVTLCEGIDLSLAPKLKDFLQIIDEGVIKTQLDDGSVKQTKVNIVTVDATEYLEIRPADPLDAIKQGHSGSVLYVANNPAGIVLEVEEESAIVYRADALKAKLDGLMADPANAGSRDNGPDVINGLFSTSITDGQSKEFVFTAEKNSPVEFKLLNSGSNASYYFSIYNDRDERLWSNDYYMNREYSFAYTPQATEVLRVRITGRSGKGTFRGRMQQWAQNSELESDANIFTIGDEFGTRIAGEAGATFRFQGEKNSPIEFILQNTGYSGSYYFSIRDERGNNILSSDYYMNRQYRFTFTPNQSKTYTARIYGKDGYGEVKVKALQWALDSELMGKANTLDVGGDFTTRIASNAVAEYRFEGQENSPLEFILANTGGDASYYFSIYNEREERLLSNDFYSSRHYRFTFTPKRTETYTIRVSGKDNYGTVKVNLLQWALDSELKGKGNRFGVGDEFSTRIANSAVAEYRFEAQQNSPLEFILNNTGGDASYYFSIYNEREERLFSSDYYASRKYRFTFTPPKSGAYRLRITGKDNYGTVSAKVLQWALDSELRGEGNSFEIGDEISARIASGAVAEFRFEGQANTPVEFLLQNTDYAGSYYFSIYDSEGARKFSNDYYMQRQYRVAVTPQQTQTYTVRIEGKDGYGEFRAKMIGGEN